MFWAKNDRPKWKGYVVAVLLVALGAAVRLELLAGLGYRVTYVTFFPAVMAAALYGGFLAGLLSTGLSAIAASYWLIEPSGNPFMISHPMDVLGMAVFIVCCAMISVFAEVTRRAQARASEAESRIKAAVLLEQSAAALRESEERLRLASNAAKMGVFEWNAFTDRAVWENDQMYEIFGHTRDNGVPSKAELVADYVHPDDVASFEQALADAAQPDRAFETVFRIRRKSDGEWRWIEVAGHLELAADGIPQRLVGVLRDITELKRSEEERARALILAEHRSAETEAVFSAIQDAVLIYDMDMNVVRTNQMFVPTYGFDPVGLNLRDIIQRTQCRRLDGLPLRLEEQPTPRALLGETVRNQRFRITRSDGTEMALETSSGPLSDGSRIIGTVTVWHDITERVQAEEALRESREDLNRAQAVAQTGSWRLNVQRNELLWSEENHRIFGVPEGTPLTYETFLSKVHSDDRDYVHEKWSACLAGEPYDIEHRLFVDDTLRWVRERAELEFDKKGVLLGGFGTTQDITERKRAEQALIESEARFRLLSETADRLLSSPNPLAVVQELCGKVMEHLDCQAFFNFMADERTGKLHLNGYAGISREDAQNIEWLDYGVAVCGCAARDGIRIVAEDIDHTPDARTDLVKSYGIRAYACHPLMAGGRVIGTLSFGTKTRPCFSSQDLVFMRTVTDQVAVAMERARLIEELQRSQHELESRVSKRTDELAKANLSLQAEVLERRRFEQSLMASEENLRKNNELLQTLLDGITDPLIMLDREGLMKMTNKAAFDYYGVAPNQDVFGKRCFRVLTGREDVCPGCEYPFPAVGTSTATFERKGIHDPRRIEHVALYPVLDEHGRRDAVIVRISDITKAKLLERQILQNEKLASLGLLTSGIAHEINNPNSFVVFNIPILRKYLEELLPIIDQYAAAHPDYELFNMSYPELREDIFALLNNMEHGAQRITRIVGVLKGFVRQKDSGEIHKTDLRELVDKVVTLCRTEMKRRVKTFEVMIPDDLPPIFADADALEQAVLNLLINAVHACDKQDSLVRLKVERGQGGGEDLVIEVSDNGSGIEESLMDRIFDPFFTTKPSAVGTGLGLYICHDRVQAMGGNLEVESCVGQGSTFRIVLPQRDSVI